MTLLECLACGDVVKLGVVRRACCCGRSAGTSDGDGTRYLGPARVVRFFGDVEAEPRSSTSGRWETLDDGAGATRVPVAPLL
jgi:hypothetical protein